MKRNLLFYQFILAIAAFMPYPVLSQETTEAVTVTGYVSYVNEKGKPQENFDEVAYVALANGDAIDAERDFRDCFGKMKGIDQLNRVSDLFDKYGINQNSYTHSLFYKTKAIPERMSILFVSEEQGLVVRLPIVKGKTDYKDEVKFKMNALGEVIKTGHASEQAMASVEAEDTDDGYVTINWKLYLPRGFAREDARMILQPYVIDCQTEDTMAYMGAKALEGEKYHKLQNKRMAYNYMKNDKLARNRQTGEMIFDEVHSLANFKNELPVRVSGAVRYKKPDSILNHTFDAPLYYSLEDYNHVYLDSMKECDCLSYRPFKFLDFSAALANLELTREFYEKPNNQIQDKKQRLNLRFELGKSVLTSDEENDKIFDQLKNELMSAGKTLIGLTVSGAASPDGSVSVNERLARERAQVARSKISQFVSVQPSVGAPKVYTWSDVADRLREQAKDTLANEVAAIVARGGTTEAQGRAIAALPDYKRDIEPILTDMRVMTCSYQFTRTYIMQPEECVEMYYKNKHDYLSGKRSFSDFSNGDVYNLFATIKDSLELDTITELAYKELIREPEYEKYNAVSPYVCNRMSVILMKKGKPNTEILKPFIDIRRRGNQSNEASPASIDYEVPVRGRGKVKFNRRQIMVNQTVCYYMDTKADTAMFFVKWLKGAIKGDPNIERMEKFINLKQLHPKRNKLRGQDLQDYLDAKKVALETSDENKAILYTEIGDWNMRDHAVQWVNKMDDADARKWYLKGILWAQKAKKDVAEPPINTYRLTKKSKEDGQFYRWSDVKMGEMFGTPELEEYKKQYMKWKEEHPGEEPPLEGETISGSNDGTEGNAVGTVDVNLFKEIPRYLAYFHHAFTMDRTMWEYYMGEKNVSAETRKAFPYRRSNKKLYEEMFELLKNEDDTSLLGASSDPESEESSNAQTPQSEANGNAEEQKDRTDAAPETPATPETKE